MWCWKSADHRKHKKLLGSTVQRTSTYRQKNLSYRYCAWGPVTQHPHVARPYGAWFGLDELVGTGATLLLSILKDSPTAHRLTYTTQGKHANVTINRAECICIGCLPFISFFPLIAKTQNTVGLILLVQLILSIALRETKMDHYTNIRLHKTTVNTMSGWNERWWFI